MGLTGNGVHILEPLESEGRWDPLPLEDDALQIAPWALLLHSHLLSMHPIPTSSSRALVTYPMGCCVLVGK